jgi:hypothetical protein
MPTVTAPNSLKVVAVLDPRELLDLVVPDGRQRLGLTIRLPDRTVIADLSAKSVRRAINVIREYGPDAVAAIVQGRLVGSEITEAGLSAQPKAARQPAPEKVAAA